MRPRTLLRRLREGWWEVSYRAGCARARAWLDVGRPADDLLRRYRVGKPTQFHLGVICTAVRYRPLDVDLTAPREA